ncbi:DUF4390 domain-containing protein [Polynucleobacter sp. IMCC30063]|uniref:DUF4390 domain-containing protein n=1 Tax=Polynucleobacter sp. IMCC30063 TaxID=2907298 RepID=UPI001F161516|nr:DUF4390 domain-containing protein [Polynucleobacter sp. IMCC30063]MCE7504870.1 DUF4390 domain-containing protein [Polynucleobacter sp. IMCC30063]
MTRRLNNWILYLILGLGLGLSPLIYAEGIKVKAAEIERVDTDWLLNAVFNIELSPGLEDALQKGLVLTFQTEFELTRGRWYWFDERPSQVTRQTRVSYQPLTKQYRISTEGFSFSVATMREALQAAGTIGGWRVIERANIDLGKTYIAALRMTLDLSKLPKPFQVNALNNRDWNVLSDWLRFPFSPSFQNVIAQ